MLFCKSSTVSVGTIAPICTASCVVATIASLCSSCVVHQQASGPCVDLQAQPCKKIARPTWTGGLRSSLTSKPLEMMADAIEHDEIQRRHGRGQRPADQRS